MVRTSVYIRKVDVRNDYIVRNNIVRIEKGINNLGSNMYIYYTSTL